MGKKVIKFGKYFEEFLPLSPAKLNVPLWYKDIPALNDLEPNFWNKKTLKNCMPFLDSLTVGYQVLLPADILVENDFGTLKYSWHNGEYDLVSLRPNTHPYVPLLPGFAKQHPAWIFPFALNFPSNYSLLITHPFNRFDLPFFTLTGIVDSYAMPGGKVPFMIKEDFTGIITRGTPIAQILPFKRENWKSEESSTLVKESALNSRKSKTVFKGWYKSNIWKKKTYE